jgi:ADP-ribose pyrophosphatase YjhB (NUDIX family)
VTAGRDYIGVGVGAIVFDSEGKAFFAKRGNAATNEREVWEFPGGGVQYGERLIDAVKREFLEEYGMEIEIVESLGFFDHILPDEKQHWVTATFIARHIGGTPRILEPQKCTAIGWFPLSAPPTPLSRITQENLKSYRTKDRNLCSEL